MAIRCCYPCTPPKRYPGCHDKCPEYLAEKAEHEKQKAADYERRRLKGELISQRDKLYFKALKRRRS